MVRNPFTFINEVERTWPYIDDLARRAWEKDDLTQEQKREVGDAAGNFYNKLLKVTKNLPREKFALTQPPSGQDIDKGNWNQFARQELVNMIGREDISSIAEAYLKSISLLRVLQGEAPGHHCFLFRGQRDISWPLLPRKGRALINADWTPPGQPLNEHNRTKVLNEELEGLEAFIDQWHTLDYIDELDQKMDLPRDHPEWWFRMQHYDIGDGTRMLDLTTSLNAALLFACVDWNTGQIDQSTDGIVYLLEEGRNGNVVNFLLEQLPKTTQHLFENFPDAPVYILNPPQNERSKAQSGAFIWWPRFWELPPFGAPYYLRINAQSKSDIVRDLLSMGFGPKDVVRGQKGLINEQALRKQLDLKPWNPIQLEQ